MAKLPPVKKPPVAAAPKEAPKAEPKKTKAVAVKPKARAVKPAAAKKKKSKATPTKKTEAPVATTEAVAYDTGLAIPAATRLAPSSPLRTTLTTMPVGASVLVPLKPEDGDQATARARSRSRINGLIARIRKDNPDLQFAVRAVDSEELGVGVRVWRQEAA